MNKILVKLYIPAIEENFDILIPPARKIHSVITLIVKAIKELTGEVYEINGGMPSLYNKTTALPYDMKMSVKDAGIVNGTELILI